MTTTIATITNNALVARHITAIAARTGSTLMGTAKALLIEEAKRQMREGVCHFIFRKADGSIREAYGTLNPALCGKHINGRGISPEYHGCTCFWCVEKGGFRSFRWANLIAVL